MSQETTTPSGRYRLDVINRIINNATDAETRLAALEAADALLAPLASPTFTGVPVVPTYTVVTVPDATATPGGVIFVSDAVGTTLTGHLAVSNGTVWINTDTGAAVTT